MQYIVIWVGLFVVAACSSPVVDPITMEAPIATAAPSHPATDPAQPTPTAQTCPAKDLQYLVGQPRAVLNTMRFGTVVRFEEPGQVVTMDYSAQRTRIIIDADGKIARIVCG